MVHWAWVFGAFFTGCLFAFVASVICIAVGVTFNKELGGKHEKKNI